MEEDVIRNHMDERDGPHSPAILVAVYEIQESASDPLYYCREM